MLELVFDSSEFTEWENKAKIALPIALQLTTTQLKEKLPEVLSEVFYGIMRDADFPEIYIEHVMLCLPRVKPMILTTSTDIIANINLDVLGTWDDLALGYHRGAIMESIKGQTAAGSHHSGHISDFKITLPYAGQALLNGLEKREAFWRAVFTGEGYEAGSGTSRVTIDTEGMYEETLKDRVRVWGNKAPEWLILQWGSTKDGTPPVVKPQLLKETLNAAFQDTCSIAFAENTEYAMETLPAAAGPGQYTRNGATLNLINNSAQNIYGRFTTIRY